jgi:hypothetical protein
MNLKKIGKVFTSKFVGTGLSSYETRIYQAAVSQRLRNTDLYFDLPSSLYHRTFGQNFMSPRQLIIVIESSCQYGVNSASYKHHIRIKQPSRHTLSCKIFYCLVV